MTDQQLSRISARHVVTVPAALKALAAMERELLQASTYAEIRKVVDAGEALKLLFRDVDVVKIQAEDVILAASARIGEEIAKVPKGKPGPKGLVTAHGKQFNNRKNAMPSGTSRARYQKLAAAKTQLKTIAKKLREQGKDATPSAVVRELTQGNKKVRRAEREQALADKTMAAAAALQTKLYNVIYADPPWRFEPYSRETGMDRAADGHYPTMTLDAIMAIEVPAADDCVLFLWATAPMLLEALDVMAAWGFDYKTHFVWAKPKMGTGYWNRNKHELLLLGVKGSVPAPAQGDQYESLIPANLGRHSEKPAHFAEIIEDMFPKLSRLEMFARSSRLGWDVWGNEAES